MNVQNQMRLLLAGAIAVGLAVNGDGLIGDGPAQTYAQTPGQIAAQQIRNQAVAKAMQERGITLPQSQYPINQSRRFQQSYVPYQTYRSYRPSYSGGYVNPYYSGYQYGYPQPYGGYGYGTPSYGYGYGAAVYQYRTVPNSSSSSSSNRLPGSNYFGDPHASQYFGR